MISTVIKYNISDFNNLRKNPLTLNDGEMLISVENNPMKAKKQIGTFSFVLIGLNKLINEACNL